MERGKTQDKRLEEQLYLVAQRKMRAYVWLDVWEGTINETVIRDLAVLEWQLYQKYRKNSTSYYVSEKSYREDLKKIHALELKIRDGEKRQIEAEDTVKEAKELLWLIAGSRIKQKDNNRVF